jgi:ParB family transcriptional regulator, chromosome partitioning protein
VAERQKGMGRGLAAILSVAPRDEAEELRQLPLELIAPNPSQPRGRFDEQSLLMLADSIRQRGVLQPVLVRPLIGGRYELVAGERRWRAARSAELETIPAVIRHHDDAASLEVALVENMVREDLNPVEEARACAALVEELGLTREQVGLRVALSNLIRLLDLPDEALELLERGELSEGHGRALLLTDDHLQRRRLAREAASGGWSVRQLEARARTVATEAAPGSRSRPGRRLHPDQQTAVEQIGDALTQALGCEVEVAPARGGYRVQLPLLSLDEALDLARRLRVRAAASGAGRESRHWTVRSAS